MLVVEPARGDDQGVRLPIGTAEVLVARLPDQREAHAVEDEQVRSSARVAALHVWVDVALLVGPDGKFGDMAVEHRIDHAEHDVESASAALLPLLKLERFRVRDEVRRPDAAGAELAFAAEVRLVAGVAIVEYVRVVPEEAIALEDRHHERRVVVADEPRRLIAAVEVLVPRIERN